LTHLKYIALYYFTLKRKQVEAGVLQVVLERLWRDTYQEVLPILNNIHRFGHRLRQSRHDVIQRAVEALSWRGASLLKNLHASIFEGAVNVDIQSLHAYDVGCFDKGKLNKGLELGRAYQLGRIGGDFLYVGTCDSGYMPDAPSLPKMLKIHEKLFGEASLQSIATDKGYYSLANEQALIKQGVPDIHLPRPSRVLNAAPETTPWSIRKLLHNRRSDIGVLRTAPVNVPSG